MALMDSGANAAFHQVGPCVDQLAGRLVEP